MNTYRPGHYIPGDSPVHRLDPRVKIGSVVLLSIIILQGNVLSLFLISLVLPAIVFLSNLSLGRVGRAVGVIRFFVLIFFFVHLLFTPGDPIPPFPIWHIAVTSQGLVKGLMVSWRFTLLILSGSILTMTTSPSEFMCAIERIFRPLKVLRVSSHDIAIMISIALRFVPTIAMEIARMKEAQRARGACFKGGNLLKRARANLALLVPLMIRTLNRADNLVTAMEARGFQRGTRTYLRELRLKSLDYGVIALMAITAGIFVFKGQILRLIPS
ncbi:MAG: energy-coupling factor transporter transmembrane protein EcfT [Deltaproteobacteria bacterium]|nr:energy-coupling factor transporter transmembrane protein EcfT [Deltaproteobacteria bacterium]